ncbi:CvpA family protein [Candidatus Parabeggiatoa sp. HSG14]|uniref:CvpA family protein n=1 Tax=Candidatus Parabeggiatoa sp. HSG14 TaxID=3055593 RepID=UPI0025A91B31|nr:CvpA family protein [Thiotrichales bacterium HSG14]
MNWADFSILTLLLLSTVISFFQGFVKELFSFLAWLLSLVIALIFLEELVSLLTTLISFADLRIGVALITLFFTTFILLEWISYLILNSIGRTKVSIPARILAILFGIARGGVVITLLIMLAGLTQLPNATWWQESVFVDKFKPMVIELRRYLPLDIAMQFNFEPALEQRKP